MAYTTINKSTDYFNTKLYTGNGSTNAITGVGFQPDWVWIKDRQSTEHHNFFDAVRGATNRMYSSSTAAQDTASTTLTAFNSDGFTLGSSAAVNASGNNTVSWNWKANGAGSSNTDGSITSTVSANTTSGFSISSYTGTGSNATVGHGLGVAPKVIIAKNLGTTQNWFVYHQDIQSSNADGYINLNTTDAVSDSSTVWQSTAPTSSVFSTGAAFSAHDYVAYCFAEKTGFSKFGSYTGNGNADGAFIYTGFKVGWIMTRAIDIGGGTDWYVFDNKRPAYNLTNLELQPNNTGIESSDIQLDILSNGFKPRGPQGGHNGNGNNYIYMAFAEAPLVGSNNVPATAR